MSLLALVAEAAEGGCGGCQVQRVGRDDVYWVVSGRRRWQWCSVPLPFNAPSPSLSLTPKAPVLHKISSLSSSSPGEPTRVTWRHDDLTGLKAGSS